MHHGRHGWGWHHRWLIASVASGGALLASVLAASSAVAAPFDPPTVEPNRAGRSANVCLYDFGDRTAALYVFSAGETSATRQLFWKSARGKFAAARASTACGDVNADARPDALVLYDLGRGRAALYAFLSTGTRFVKTTAWRGRLHLSRARLVCADANGDGADDAYIYLQKTSATATVYSHLSAVTPSTTAAPAKVAMARTTAWPASAYAGGRAQLAAADVDADGSDDLVALRPTADTTASLDVFVSHDGVLTLTGFWSGALQTTRARLACGDVDADGRGDALLLHDEGAGNARLLVARSSGGTFADPTTWWTSAAGACDWATTRLACGDPNGDGRADALLLAPGPDAPARAWRSPSQTQPPSAPATYGTGAWSGLAPALPARRRPRPWCRPPPRCSPSPR